MLRLPGLAPKDFHEESRQIDSWPNRLGKPTFWEASIGPDSDRLGSPEDIKAIEAVAHGNQSDHVTDDVSFTNIFGTVRYGHDEFIRRHIEIAKTFFKGTTPKSSIAKLRFVRPDVASEDVSGEISGFQKTYAEPP